MWTWTAATGLADPAGTIQAGTTQPARALEHAVGVQENAVFVFCDLHAWFGSDHRPADPAVVRKVRETALEFRHGEASRALIITSPVRAIPPELDKLVHLLDFPLPTREELRDLLRVMIENNTSGDGGITVGADDAELETLVQAALGLTMSEAEDAFARAMVDDGRLTGDDVDVVLDEKRQAVRKSGLLEFVDPGLDLDKVGGLNNLKRWLGRRRAPGARRPSGSACPPPGAC